MFYYLVRFPRGQQEEITAADSVTMMLYLFIEKSHNSLSSGVWLKPSGLIGRRTESQDSRSLHLKERRRRGLSIIHPVNNAMIYLARRAGQPAGAVILSTLVIE